MNTDEKNTAAHACTCGCEHEHTHAHECDHTHEPEHEHVNGHSCGCDSCGDGERPHEHVRETVPFDKVIERLDEAFAENDLSAADRILTYWEDEARRMGDAVGLLQLRSEQIGLYRRLRDEERAVPAVYEALGLIDCEGFEENAGIATVIINAATTLCEFGRAAEAYPLYDKAEKIYRSVLPSDDYRMAALFNNRAACEESLGRGEAAERNYREAIAVLRANGEHDAELAVSYVNLAQLHEVMYEQDDERYALIARELEEAWEILTGRELARDGNFAFVLSKCAPSFTHFGQAERGELLAAEAKKIYEGA